MTTAEFSASLIAIFEGCKLTAYKDTGGVLTIGYGHTGADVTEGLTITQEKAQEFLQADLKPLLVCVAEKPTLEAAAFVSFGYNCGLSAMKRAIAGETNMMEWIRDAKKNKLDHLVRRRGFENSLIQLSKSQATETFR